MARVIDGAKRPREAVAHLTTLLRGPSRRAGCWRRRSCAS